MLKSRAGSIAGPQGLTRSIPAVPPQRGAPVLPSPVATVSPGRPVRGWGRAAL